MGPALASAETRLTEYSEHSVKSSDDLIKLGTAVKDSARKKSTLHTHTHIYTPTHTHIYTHTPTHIHVYTHMHTQIHIHTPTYMPHTHLYTYTHVYTHAHTDTYTPTYMPHTYTYTCTHICIHIHAIYTYRHTYIHLHIYTHTHTHTHIQIYTCLYTYTYTPTRTCTYTHLHIYIHTPTYTYTYTHMHIHLHAHTYAHTHSLRQRPSLWGSWEMDSAPDSDGLPGQWRAGLDVVRTLPQTPGSALRPTGSGLRGRKPDPDGPGLPACSRWPEKHRETLRELRRPSQCSSLF